MLNWPSFKAALHHASVISLAGRDDEPEADTLINFTIKHPPLYLVLQFVKQPLYPLLPCHDPEPSAPAGRSLCSRP